MRPYGEKLAALDRSEQASEPEKEEKRPDFLEIFRGNVMSAGQLRALEIPPKKRLLGDFFCEADLGYIYGERGFGKTWLTTDISRAIATGTSCGEWEAGEEAARVLVVDGEMALKRLQERADQLNVDGVTYLHHESVYSNSEQTINLAIPAQQRALLALCKETNISVLILDNLSCLFRGMKENDSHDWEMVAPWLLSFRRENIAVILVAHAGRNGMMRGTSKREDAADWILKLKAPTDKDEEAEGARFVTSFSKNRNSVESDCPSLLWEFSRDGAVTCEKHSGYEAFLDLVKLGVDQNKEIAAELNVSTAMVSKWAKKAERDGQIIITHRLYKPTS